MRSPPVDGSPGGNPINGHEYTITNNGEIELKNVDEAKADAAADSVQQTLTAQLPTIAQDAGKAIHPSYVEGQMQGGVVQGIGWALNEEYFYDDKGEMRNASFLDYRIPTAFDLPMIETIIVEVPNPDHPYGVRGVGEVSIVPPPAAIANAIHRAVGVRMRELPISPPKLWKAIRRSSR